MKITNEAIARQFNELADLLEIKNANPFRVRAYRTAARTISSLGKDVTELIASGYDLTELPGIGKDLANKIAEIVKSGQFSLLKETEAHTPQFLSELMKIEGLGPKRVKILHEKLHINSVEDLKKAIDDGSLQTIRGFGVTTASKLKAALKHAAEYSKRTRLADVWQLANILTAQLKMSNAINEVEIAGSFRRRKETVGDLDIVASAKDTKTAISHFLSSDLIETIIAQGRTKVSVRLKMGQRVDFRVVPHESFGAALIYFTGSKDHNVAIRKLALRKKLKLNEYGLFKGKKNLAGLKEAAIYKAIGLRYIEPEMREAQGEIEASLAQKLPTLIAEKDIRGNLHTHTKETDGKERLETMVLAAKDMGYEYIAITDHSKHLTVTKGLDEKRLLKQIKVIDKLNEKLSGITILKSIEVDILEKGKLDLSNNVLKELDLTICSVHSRFNLSAKEQTDRIIRAMDNKYFNILAHPTGRLINRRHPYAIDLESIMKTALKNGCFLELNAQPERLDLNDIYCKMAKDMGLKLAISTDAHSVLELHNMKFGVFQARRGWLEKDDVINTRTLAKLKKLLKRW